LVICSKNFRTFFLKICEDIIKANTHEKMMGADYRMVLIETYLYLFETNISTDILLLVETILRLSQILYLPEKERTPRRILQMYILFMVAP